MPHEEIQDSLLEFWRNFSQQFPAHQVFDAANKKQLVLRRTLPLYIHGDEGRHYKKSGIMIVNMQGAIGKGSKPFFKKAGSKKKGKKQVQGLNVGGHSFRSRLLLMAFPKTYYSQESDVYTRMFDCIVSDLQKLEQSGFEFQGETWHVQVLGLKGDLPFLTKTSNLTRHYLRAARSVDPRAPPVGMCFYCSAGQTGIPYEDVSEEALWTKTASGRPWQVEPSFTLLRHIEETPEFFLKIDLWHCFHGGMGMDFASSSLVEILQRIMPGTNIGMRCKGLNDLLATWVRRGNPRPHSGAFLPERVGLTSWSVCPDAGWSKFNDTTIYMKFIQHVLETSTEVSGDSTLQKILSATKDINAAMSLLFSSGLWLKSNEALKAGRLGRQWICKYIALAKEAFEERRNRFPIHSKLHYLDHIFRSLVSNGTTLSTVLNPVQESVQQDEDTLIKWSKFLFFLGQHVHELHSFDFWRFLLASSIHYDAAEDFVGQLARLSRRTSPVAAAIRTLQRYTVRLHELWSREINNEMESWEKQCVCMSKSWTSKKWGLLGSPVFARICWTTIFFGHTRTSKKKR